eukprot:Em0005g133a
MASRVKQDLMEGMKGVKGLLSIAKNDFVNNSKDLKQDFKEILEMARAKRRSKQDSKPLSALDAKINPDAGAELLSHYRHQWSAIHKSIQSSSEVIQSVDAMVTRSGTEFAHEQEKQQERQSHFGELFEKQMSEYKETGELDRPISESEQGTSLENITIEDTDGVSTLNQFLGDVRLEDQPLIPEVGALEESLESESDLSATNPNAEQQEMGNAV